MARDSEVGQLLLPGRMAVCGQVTSSQDAVGHVAHPQACVGMAGEQLQRGANLAEGVDAVPPYFDTFAEYKEFCVQYRSKLSQIVRATAGWLPEQARDLGCGEAACSDLHQPPP